MEKKVVLVTGLGGNVGQGILRNIIDLKLPIRLVGTDIENFTAGSHLCDITYKVPFAYEEKYIEIIKEIVIKEKVDLIIPSTDYEVYYLSLNQKSIKTEILASDAEIAKKYLDKFETYLLFSKYGIPFAKSWLPKNYDFSEKQIIAKPKEGRGSRGILINPEKPNSLPDNYMIQPLYKGTEITTAAYVTKENKLHGIFTMERKLTNGTTTESKVTFEYDKQLEEIANKMIELGGIKGSFNIQSIVVNDSKNIVPFEINCRISGTNSIRHNLGFQDVKYAIQEFLLKTNPETPKPIKGIATRIMMDVIYKDKQGTDELFNNKSNYLIY